MRVFGTLSLFGIILLIMFQAGMMAGATADDREAVVNATEEISSVNMSEAENTEQRRNIYGTDITVPQVDVLPEAVDDALNAAMMPVARGIYTTGVESAVAGLWFGYNHRALLGNPIVLHVLQLSILVEMLGFAGFRIWRLK